MIVFIKKLEFPLIYKLADPGVFACAPALPRAEWQTGRVRNLVESQLNWSREQRSKYWNLAKPSKSSQRGNKFIQFFCILFFSKQDIFQGFPGILYNHLHRTITKSSLAKGLWWLTCLTCGNVFSWTRIIYHLQSILHLYSLSVNPTGMANITILLFVFIEVCQASIFGCACPKKKCSPKRNFIATL